MTAEDRAKEIVLAHFGKARLEHDADVQALRDDIAAALRPSEAVRELVEAVNKWHAEIINGDSNNVTCLRLHAALAAVRKEFGQ